MPKPGSRTCPDSQKPKPVLSLILAKLSVWQDGPCSRVCTRCTGWWCRVVGYGGWVVLGTGWGAGYWVRVLVPVPGTVLLVPVPGYCTPGPCTELLGPGPEPCTGLLGPGPEPCTGLLYRLLYRTLYRATVPDTVPDTVPTLGTRYPTLGPD